MCKKEKKECIVCYEDLTTKDKPLKECGHHIHKLCILKSGKNKCPLCRTELKLSKKDMIRCKEYYLNSIKMDIKEYNPILHSLNDKDLMDILNYISTI
jgi:hypothetical protein